MAEGGHAREFRGGRCCARSLSLSLARFRLSLARVCVCGYGRARERRIIATIGCRRRIEVFEEESIYIRRLMLRRKGSLRTIMANRQCGLSV